ncbi:hypothetical protein Aduo_007347 [Ancylostoma duodenale]
MGSCTKCGVDPLLTSQQAQPFCQFGSHAVIQMTELHSVAVADEPCPLGLGLATSAGRLITHCLLAWAPHTKKWFADRADEKTPTHGNGEQVIASKNTHTPSQRYAMIRVADLNGKCEDMVRKTHKALGSLIM